MTWVSAQAAAALLNLTVDAVYKAIKQNKYVHRHVTGVGRGGKRMEIMLESLPADAQACYYNEPPPGPEDNLGDFTFEQRREAEVKTLIVEEYQSSGLSPDDFANWHNEAEPDNPITKSQLFRWQRKYKARDGDIVSLVDKRGGHNKDHSSIPPNVWQCFYNKYMTLQKRSIQRCWELAQIECGDIPHISSFKRKVEKIPYRAILKYREGQDAFKNSLPHMERDYTTINSNDVWFSDEHVVDVFNKNKVGKPTRYYFTLWFDARGRKVLGYGFRDKPADTGFVKETFRMSMEEFGVPFEAYVDNGKAYKSKDGLNNDWPLSLARRLGINTIYATPRHGQAKAIIERFFGTFESRIGKLFPTYAGRDAKQRPDPLHQTKKKTDKYLQLYAPSEEEFLKAVDAYIDEYNNTPHTGHGMDGATPNEVYARELKVKQVISDREALRLLCGRMVERTVQRNGIQIMERTYRHDALQEHYKEKVLVVYDPANVDEMNIFTAEGKAICVATPTVRTSFRNTSDRKSVV